MLFKKLNKTVGLIDFALPLGRNMPRIYTEKINNLELTLRKLKQMWSYRVESEFRDRAGSARS